MSKYEEMMDQRDFYQSEALRFKDDPEKSAAFTMLAEDWEKKARNLKIEEALK